MRVIASLISGLALWSLASLSNAEVHTLRLAESWGENTALFGDTTQRFATLVRTLSNDRLRIEIDSAEDHGQPLGIFDLVKSGQYDMGHSASYYWKDRLPNALYFTTMPFGMIASEQYAWFYRGDGMALMDEVYRPHNLYSFPGGNTGQQMGGWFRKEIRSLDDLKGLRMRIPGFAGEVLAELGVETVNLASTELYEALESGRIDALEWVGPSLDFDFGFHRIAPYYYTGWHEPATELQFLINRQAFDALPADLKAILSAAMRTVAFDMWVQAQHDSAQNWQTIRRDYPNVQVRTFPPDIMRALREANRKQLEARAKVDPLAARIIASQTDYLTKARKWIDISERAYLGNMDAQGNRVE